MVAVLEAQHQDSGLRELEADTAEPVLDVVGPQRPVGEGHGHRVGFQLLGVGQFLVLIDLAVAAVHHVSGHRVPVSR